MDVRVVRQPMGVAVIALAVSIASGCGPRPETHGQRRLTIATGVQRGVNHLLGQTLADIYNAEIPGIAASVIETSGSGFNVRAIEDGTADVGFVQADVGFFALHDGTSGDARPYGHLRAVASLYSNAVQFVVLRSSSIHRLEDLQGRRVGVTATASGTKHAAPLILEAGRWQKRIANGRVMDVDDLETALQRGDVDAGVVVSSFPVPAVATLNTNAGIRLVPIGLDLANRIRGDYPFFHPMVIPAGAYEGQKADVATIGVDNLLLCRSDLPDDLVYRLTRVFIESLATLSRVHGAAGSIDPELAQTSPIQLHSGAARFYRERELFQ